MCCNSFVVIRTLKGFHILISLSSATVTKCIRWRCHECRAVTCTQCHAVSRITPGQECPETRREGSTLTVVYTYTSLGHLFSALLLPPLPRGGEGAVIHWKRRPGGCIRTYYQIKLSDDLEMTLQWPWPFQFSWCLTCAWYIWFLEDIFIINWKNHFKSSYGFRDFKL